MPLPYSITCAKQEKKIVRCRTTAIATTEEKMLFTCHAPKLPEIVTLTAQTEQNPGVNGKETWSDTFL